MAVPQEPAGKFSPRRVVVLRETAGEQGTQTLGPRGVEIWVEDGI